jgi:hypothetical protein
MLGATVPPAYHDVFTVVEGWHVVPLVTVVSGWCLVVVSVVLFVPWLAH